MSVRVAFAISLTYGLRGSGVLLTSQFWLSALAQDGFGTAHDNPTAANRGEIHRHNYGEFERRVWHGVMVVVTAAATRVAQASESRASQRG